MTVLVTDVDAVSEGAEEGEAEEEDAASGGNGRPAVAPAGEEDGPPRQTRPAPIGGGSRSGKGSAPSGGDSARIGRIGAGRAGFRRDGVGIRGAEGDRFGGIWGRGGNDGDDATEEEEEEVVFGFVWSGLGLGLWVG